MYFISDGTDEQSWMYGDIGTGATSCRLKKRTDLRRHLICVLPPNLVPHREKLCSGEHRLSFIFTLPALMVKYGPYNHTTTES